MSEFRIPEILIVDNLRGAELWNRWIEEYEIYECAKEIENKPEKVQIGIFLNIIGPDGVTIFKSFKDKEITVIVKEKNVQLSGKLNLDWIKTQFNKYCIPRRNVTYERYVFFKRAQEDNENIDTYHTELKKLSINCEFKDLRDSIKDRLIIGMKDDMLRQRLLQEATGKELTAERLIEFARTKEIGNNQSEEIRGKENIDYVQNDYKKNKFEYKRGDTKKKCSRCNNIHEPKKCKAYGTKCANCKRTGHWAVCYRSKKVDEVRIEKNNHLENEEFTFLGEVSICTEDNDPWIRDVRVNTEKGNQVIRFKIDTGASVSVIPDIQNLSNLSRTNKTFRGPGNTKLEVLGYFVGKLSYKEKEIEEEIYVIKNQTTGLLSRNASVKLGMIILINEVKKESLYEGLGQLKTQYKIRVRKDAIPYSIYVPRPVPLRMQEEVKKELKRMQDLGVIAESEGPSEWWQRSLMAKYEFVVI